MNEELIEVVKKEFVTRFPTQPLLVKSPGRINLIGEHTDYNEGFVLPAAINQSIYFAIGKSAGTTCCLYSVDFDSLYEFDLAAISRLPTGSWQNYVLGVVVQLQDRGCKIGGFNMVFSGDVPKGSGMSSSAALECGTCVGLQELFDLDIPKLEIPKISQKAEHEYAQVMCGIMDQFASTMGKKDHALMLDCRSLEFDYFPIELENHTLVLCNSNVSHSLADSEYNVRRAQCEEGVAILKKEDASIHTLRDVSLEMLESSKDQLSNVVYLRCKYVVEENLRVASFSKAVSTGDLKSAGNILKIAQEAMKNEYEITCPEIDFMADFANEYPGVLGSRMMGGGFGGCTLNLLEKGQEAGFISELSKQYKAKFQKNITPIEVCIDDGVHRLN